MFFDDFAPGQIHRLGRRTIPAPVLTGFMVALIAAELAAFTVIFSGFLLARRT